MIPEKHLFYGDLKQSFIHKYHLNRAIRKLCKERNITKSNREKRKRRNTRPTITAQIDKSTCLSYNNDINEFGYKGIPNPACMEVVKKIEKDLNVIIDVEIQSTHTFDLNAQDAMYHSSFKLCLKRLKDEAAPSKHGGAAELKAKVMNVYRNFDPRTIQKEFMRVYSGDHFGDLNEGLIPETLKDWYLDEDSDVSDFEVYIEDNEVHTEESDSEETS